MGAWGPGSFDNDDALDFLDDLLDGETGEPELEEALRAGAVGSSDGTLEAPEACAALVAAELVAAARGRPPADLPDGAVEYVRGHGEIARLAPLALRAAQRSLAPGSELAVLWAESEEADRWRARVTQLVERLS